MTTYRLSTYGRALILAYIAATLALGAFAAWLLADALGTSAGAAVSDLFDDRACFVPSEADPLPPPDRRICTQEQADAARNLLSTGGKLQLYLLLALIIAIPALIWNLLAELTASYTVDRDGLGFRSLGLRLRQPWETIAGLKTSSERGDGPPRIDLLIAETDARPSLWRRFFHRNTLGRIPIYGLVANREALVATIKESTEAAGQQSAAV